MVWKVYLKGELVGEYEEQDEAEGKLWELIFEEGYDYEDVMIVGEMFKWKRRW